MYRAFILLFFLGNCFSCFAAPEIFDFNTNCIKAYRQLMSLQNVEADTTLRSERNKNPNNIIPHYLADYQDCLQLLFNGNTNDYNTLKPNQELRLKIIETGDNNSPWYRFCKANIHLHWALVHLRFGDNFAAATKFRKSFLLLQENQKRFPNFEENKVLLGLEQAMAGAIPDNYKWLSSIFGIKGNTTKGVAAIVSYLNAHPDGNAPIHEEAMIYYAYLKFYLLANQADTWKFLNSPVYNETNNLMRSFIKANIAINYRKSDAAINILSKASTLPTYNQYPILQYEMGEAKLLHLDLTATSHFQLFIKFYKGKNFVKDAWLKQAYIAYLQRNISLAQQCLAKVLTEGNTATEADKQALRFAQTPIWPLPTLLEVQLLIDGGYYPQALLKIKSIDKKQLNTTTNILHYNFRYGRIFEELGQPSKALQFYTATILQGRNQPDYYAARAALHAGFIYERQGNKQAAIAQFRDCLSMHHHDQQSAIDQQAKAGLLRLQ